MNPDRVNTGGEKLVCIKECVAPGYGHWKNGDVLTDPALVNRFKDNPHFEIQRED